MKHMIVLIAFVLIQGCASSSDFEPRRFVSKTVGITYQPKSYVGNKMATIKNQNEHRVWEASGDSRLGRAIGSQVVPYSRSSVNTVANSVFGLGGILNNSQLNR